MGVVGADEATEDATAGGRGKPPGDDEVLQRHGDAEEPWEGGERLLPCPPGRGESAIRGFGGVAGPVFVERRPRVKRPIRGPDARQ